MEIKEFEGIKRKYNTLVQTESRTEGALAVKLNQLNIQFDVKTTEEGLVLLAQLQQDVKQDQTQLDQQLQHLNGVTDWSKIR